MSAKLAAACFSEKWGRQAKVTARHGVPCLSPAWKASLLRGSQAALAEGFSPVWPEMVALDSRWCYGTRVSLSLEKLNLFFVADLVEGLVCWIADLGIRGLTEDFEVTKLPLKIEWEFGTIQLPLLVLVFLLCNTGRLCWMENELWKEEGSPPNSCTLHTQGMIIFRIIHPLLQISENVRCFFYFTDVCTGVRVANLI